MKNEEIKYKRNIAIFISAFFVCFPWLTYLNIYKLNSRQKNVYESINGYVVDLFLNVKEKAIIILAIVLVLWYLGEMIFPYYIDKNIPLKNKKNRKYIYFSAVFVGISILSTLISKYKENLLWGSPTEAEGIVVIACYFVIMLAVMNYFAKSRYIRIVKKMITVLSVILIIFSLLEYFYKPIIEIDIIKRIACPKEYQKIINSIKADNFSKAISISFYNPSYYAGMVDILFSFCFSFYLAAKENKEKYLFIIITGMLIFCELASNSTTGLIVLIIESVGLIMSYYRKDGKKVVINRVLQAIVMGLIVAITVNLIGKNNIFDIICNKKINNESSQKYEISNIILDKNKLSIIGKENSIILCVNNGDFEIRDQNGKKLDADYVGGKVIINTPGYKNILIRIESLSNKDNITAKVIIDAGYDDTIDFYVLYNEKFAGVGQAGSIQENISSRTKTNSKINFYSAFTGRGYAWINSLPLLEDTILIGKGPGAFAFCFKQNDYVGLLHTHGSTKYIIDKPHNGYIQVGINIGVVALLIFVLMIMDVFVNAIKCMYDKTNEVFDVHISCVIAIIGLAFYYLTNDSMITVTPYLFLILGLTMAMNYMQKEDNRNENKRKKK